MDKIKEYKQIVEGILKKRESQTIANLPGAKGRLIIDPSKNEYVLLWVGTSYKHGLMFHVEIKDDKVWIHEDRTDSDLAGILSEHGIPKSNIVLGFVAPYARGTSGYAA